MAQSNLEAVNIQFRPAHVRAPCPVDVVVRVRNTGAAAPLFNNPARTFEVCLSSPAFVAEGGHTYRQPVTVPEDQLKPDMSVDVTFRNVRFDRGGHQLPVTATANCARPGGPAVTNDARTQARGLTIPVDVQAVAWLWTDSVAFGLTDSHGQTTVPVTAVCPGQEFWVQATITNRGLATAAPSTAQLTLTDAAGNLLQTASAPVPAIAPAFSAVATFTPGPAPTPAAGTQQVLTAQVCADVAGVVTPQCDRLHLCSPAPATAAIAADPGLPQVAAQCVSPYPYPGQPVVLDWSIQNFCSDLGSVTATVSFEGKELYKSAEIPVGMQATAGEQGVLITPAGQGQPLLNDFWKVDAPLPQRLHVEVTGTGTDPGPYTADVTFEITGEAIVPGQWQWNPSPTSADNTGNMDWNSPYAVSGTFTNAIEGAETMSATFAFTELDGSVSPPTPTGAAFTTTTSGMNPGDAIPVVWPGLKQNWQWLLPVAWVPDGPQFKPILYNVTFSLQDEFGNVYGPCPGAQLVVPVSVPQWKIDLAATATIAEGEAVVALACAVAQYAGAVFTFGASAVSATVFVGIAAGLETAANAAGVAAEDPPLPDFRYAESPHVAIPARNATAAELPTGLAPLRVLLELLDRCMAAVGVLDTIEGRWWGARIDGDAAAARRQADAYAAAVGLLRRASDALVQTAGDIVFTLRELTSPHTPQILDALARIRQGDLPAEFIAEWRAATSDERMLSRLCMASRHLGQSLGDVSGSVSRLCGTLQRIAAAAEHRAAQLGGNV